MKKKLSITLAIATLLFSATMYAQSNTSALMPMPNSIEQREAQKPFDLSKVGSIESELPNDAFCITELQRLVKKRTGLELPLAKGKNVIELKIDSSIESPEGYTIDVAAKRITLTGANENALYYAVITFDQILLGDVRNTIDKKVAAVRIEDAPRYGYRAIMLDPARHFLPVKDVKFFIDQMAKYKYNVLQIHLTDDQGWRLEIKSHPKLTEVAAFRNKNGGAQGPDNGYYTQEEMKELIEYAAKRNIEIVPELDIPGHSAAILAAYPELGCEFRRSEKINLGSTVNMMICADCERAYEVYDDIFREVAALFPSKRIHLGGDEAAVKDNWAKCEHCLELMQKSGYSEPSQLMNIFFGRMLDSVRKYGKEPILWCELDNIWPPANDYLFPYPKDVTLVTWRNALTPKCIELTRANGHKLIMAPGEYAYLDYPQWRNDLPEFNNWGMPITSLETSYKLDPSYGLEYDDQKHIMGVMATMWAEAIKDVNRVTYMAFPRALALSEAAWTNMEHRSWDSFKERLFPTLDDLIRSGVSVRVPFEIVPRD